MIKKRRAQIITVIFLVIFVYVMNHIALFKDKEFERAVRETLIGNHISKTQRREKSIGGIIWKKDLKGVEYVSINFREYKVKNIEDIKYFKNARTVWFSYASAYKGDKSIYVEEHVLDNIYLIKKFKYLEDLHLYHLKINEDIEAMFPNAEVFIR